MSTLPDIFDNGYKTNPDSRLLGHRPLVSTKPLKFGPYVWQTYKQVDGRRRCIGSALHRLFSRGELQGEDFETVGIWSLNRPGIRVISHSEINSHRPLQNGNSLISLYMLTIKSGLVFTIPLARIL
jgi:hypothetical protein